MPTAGLRVYVLGAGCSYDGQHGYPLASGFLPALEAYVAKIQGKADCHRVAEAVQQTIALLKEYGTGQYQASTIDQLVNLILRQECDDVLREMHRRSSKKQVDTVALRYDAVHNAKVATSACFLDIEERAVNRLLPKYKTFVNKLFIDSGISVPCATRLVNSKVRVFTFNYDRLFELAFFGAGLGDRQLKSYDPFSSEVLNSGLLEGESTHAKIAKDRFSFVKLHGSIGFRSHEDGFGQEIHRIGDIARWRPVKVTDDMFFSPPGQLRDSPLIIFPYEKDFILSARANKLAFRDYVANVWAHAESVFQEAEEIKIIGYSFSDPMDSEYLLKCIRKATQCRQITIQNLPEECERLNTILSIEAGIKTPIVKFPVKF